MPWQPRHVYDNDLPRAASPAAKAGAWVPSTPNVRAATAMARRRHGIPAPKIGFLNNNIGAAALGGPRRAQSLRAALRLGHGRMDPMIALIQRVREASVRVEGQLVGAIELGLLALIGVVRHDDDASAERLLQRVLDYRVF